MEHFYKKNLVLLSLVALFGLPAWIASAHNLGGPTNPDSLARLGHCSTIIEIDTNCNTHTLTLSAFVNWTWTGVHQPMSPIWSNGISAHKITVVPPGTWSWDANGTTCEVWHSFNEVTINNSFFNDSIEITGPMAICPNDGPLELTLNINGYTQFTELTWTPANPTGENEPYPITGPGTYTVSAIDAFGCSSTDQISIVKVPIFTPTITGPIRICPEGDMATLSIVNPGQYASYAWTNGETDSPITVSDPGNYEVTATDSHGCTGVGAFTLQSGGVDPFAISATSPALCPGQSDTLKVVGGYAAYIWSNNVTGISNIVNTAGTYTVTVTNFYGCTGTTSITVAALSPPLIQVLSTPLCLGDTATLTAFGAGSGQYAWSSGQSTQTITALQPGTYTVTVSGAGICATTTSTVLDFAPAPVADIVTPTPLTCLATQITLNGSGSSTGPSFPLHWSTQGGHFVSGDSTLNPTVDQAGTYVLSIVNTATGCVTNDTVLVIQNIAPPTADAGPAATLTCSTPNMPVGPIPMPTDPNLLPSWSSPNGNILGGADTWMPQIDAPGTYLLTVTDAVNGCTSVANVLIVQDTMPPIAQIAPSPLLTCMQSVVPLDGTGSGNAPNLTFQWTTANGLIAGPDNVALTGASSVGTYDLVVTNTQNGCTALASVVVAADVNIPTVLAQPPSLLTCALESTLIDASASSSGPGFQYQWTSLNGNILSGDNTLTPLVDAPGTYTLSLVNTANNCTATLAVLVNQDVTPPLADAGTDAVLNCVAPTTVLDGTGSASGANYAYQWVTLGGNIVSGDQTLTPTVDMDGVYVLQVSDLSNGCTATASVAIMNDANAPVALIGIPNVLTCNTLQTTLDATASSQTGNLTYTWSANILSGQGTLQALADQPGTYTLSITNLDNGCTDLATLTLGQDIAAPAVEAGPNGLLNCFSPLGTIGDANNPSGPGFLLQWTTLGGHFSSPTDGPTAVADQAGDYQLLITNLQNGCTATDNVSVGADFAVPMADAGPTAELNCAQTTLSLQGSGSMGPGFSYLWTTTGNISSGANTLSPVVDEPGTYQLQVSNVQNGCTAVSLVNVTENANGPMATAGLPQTLSCVLTSTNLSAAGSSTGAGFVYAWSAAAGGNISAGANTLTPSIDAPGIYTLTVTNTNNLCTQTASVTVTQNIQGPVVDAGPDPTLTCTITSLSLQAQIVSAASPGIGYAWSTSDGQIVGGANTASPLVAAPGTYVVTVTDAINGCTGTDQLLVGEDLAPPTALIANPLMLTCATTQIALNASASSAGANFIYQWTTPNGHFVSTQNQQQPTVDEPGSYVLQVTNDINGCSQTANVTVLQDIVAPIAAAGATVGLDCDTPSQALNGNGSSSGPEFTYTWTGDNGQPISGANTLSPSVIDPGTYVLSVFDTQNGCMSMDEVVVTEDVQPPLLSIAPPPVLTCLLTSLTLDGAGSNMGNTPQITWLSSGGGHIVSGGQTLHPVVDAPGNYALTIQNTVNGCTASMPVVVTENIQAPALQVQSAPLLTCNLAQFALQGIAPAQATVLWTTSDGHIVSGSNTLQPLVDAPGFYSVQITSMLNGCTNSAQVEVQEELNVPKGMEFELAPPLCNGTPGVLSVNQVDGGVGPYAYSIDSGNTFFPSETFGQLAPGNYEVVIQDANGCEIMQTVVVPDPPMPLVTAPPVFEISLGENQEIQAEVPFTFPLSLVDTVLWAPMEGLDFEGNSTLQLLNPVARPFQTTQYTVTIVTKEGCKSTARTIIQVDRQVEVYAPNVIWPDDPDGNNGVFLLFARDESVALIKTLQVFDRWGSLIFANKDFRPNDDRAGWDGEYQGQPVNPGVFVWWAEVELVDGRSTVLKGDVTVVR